MKSALDMMGDDLAQAWAERDAAQAALSKMGRQCEALTAQRDALLAALDDIVNYCGGADSALHDEYVMERARAAVEAAK